MYRPLVIRVVLAALAISATGCSSMFGDHGVFRGKDKDYLKTGTLKPIQVPEDLNSAPLEELYFVPDVSPRDEFGDEIALGEYEVPRPNAVNLEKGEVGVKIQRIGENRWIFLNASTSQVWPRTQNFLSKYGIAVAKSDPSTGLIQTAGLIFKDDEDTQSYFRIYIEKGVHPETTEIHVTQIQSHIDDFIGADHVWPDKSHNAEREAALIDDLANALAANVNNNSASLLGQNVGGELKVKFLKAQKEPTMRLNLFQQRARATVSHALGRDGFVLWDKQNDEKRSIYYVGFDANANKKGFFRRWFRESLPDEAPYKMAEVLGHLSLNSEAKEKFSEVSGAGFGNPLDKTIGMLVVVSTNAESSDVVIRDMRGRMLPPSEAKGLLRLIRKNLI